MPYSFHITAQLHDPAPARIGPGIHAVLYDLIHQYSAAHADTLHQAQILPLSLGWARCDGFGGILGRDRRTLQFRVNATDDEWGELLHDALAPGSLIGRYGQLPGRLRGQLIGQHCVSTPFEQMADVGDQCFRLHFLSPTLLRSGEAILDEPRADVLLHGLIRRARTLSSFGQDVEAWAWANESRLKIERLEQVRIPHPKVRGQDVTTFKGAIQIEFPTTRAAQCLTPVIRLAQWTGIGMKTLYGFGETRVGTFAG